MEGVEAFASRSKSLKISLGTAYPVPELSRPWVPRVHHLFSVLDFAVQHSATLVDLHVNLSVMNLDDISNETSPKHSALSFGSLVTLRICDSFYSGAHFFSNWDMPSLQRLELTGDTGIGRYTFPTFPEVMAGIILFQTDFACALSWSHIPVDFLSQCHSLKRLQVLYNGHIPNRYDDDDPWDDSAMRVAQLSSLQSLVIKFSGGYDSSFDSILQCYACSNIHSFSISVGGMSDEWSSDMDRALLDCVRDTVLLAKHSLVEFSISFETEGAYTALGALCSQLPVLRHVSITAPEDNRVWTASSLPRRPRRPRIVPFRLKLENCAGLYYSDIFDRPDSQRRERNKLPASCLVMDGESKRGSAEEYLTAPKFTKATNHLPFRCDAVRFF